MMLGSNTVWKTEAKFWTWLRGALRRAVWNRHPIKISVLKAARYKAPLGREGKMVWAIRCPICDEEVRQNNSNVDHKQGNVPLRCEEDILPFVKHLAFIKEEDLQCICIPCHKIKNYAERYGKTFEEAKKRKEEIARKKGGKKRRG